MLPEQIERKNIDFLTKSSEQEITEWLLRGDDLSLTYYKDERSRPLLFRDTVLKMTLEDQRKTAHAVVEAINKWNPADHSNEILRDLCFMAAYTRNTETIPALSSLVDTHTVIAATTDDDAESTIVAVIAGFAPDAQAKQKLSRWWEDPSFNWENRGLVFMGLLTCDPKLISKVLPSFLTTLNEHPNFSRLDYIVCEAARIIGIPKLENALAGNKDQMARKLEAFIPVAKEVLALSDNK